MANEWLEVLFVNQVSLFCAPCRVVHDVQPHLENVCHQEPVAVDRAPESGQWKRCLPEYEVWLLCGRCHQPRPVSGAWLGQPGHIDMGRDATDVSNVQRIRSCKQPEAGILRVLAQQGLNLLSGRNPQQKAARDLWTGAHCGSTPAAEQLFATHQLQVRTRLAQEPLTARLLQKLGCAHGGSLRALRQL